MFHTRRSLGWEFCNGQLHTSSFQLSTLTSRVCRQSLMREPRKRKGIAQVRKNTLDFDNNDLSQRSPLICGVSFFFTFVAVFQLHLFSSFLKQVSLHTLATTIRVQTRGSTFLQVLTNFLLSCIGALSSIIIGHRGLLFFEE